MCCTVCGHEMRKNNYDLDRHWEGHHKDLLEKEVKPSWKVPARGASLEKHGFVVKKAAVSNAETMVEKTDENEKLVEENVEEEGGNMGEGQKEIFEGVQEVEHDELNNVIDLGKDEFEGILLKRALSDESGNSENPQKRLKGSVVDAIFEKLEGLEKKIDNIKDDRSTDNGSKDDKSKDVMSKNVVEKDEEKELGVLLRECRSIGEVEQVLESFDITKEKDVEEDVDGFFCNLCFAGCKPNWKGKKPTPGTFRFDKSGEKGEKQYIKLAHLKDHVKGHFASKSHKQRRTLQSNRTKIDEERQSREKQVGMRIFRERYLGIKQRKSKRNFEEDMLRCKMNGVDVGDENHGRNFVTKLDRAIYEEMKSMMKANMRVTLEATDRERPAGLLMDKMTPNRRTGQMHGIVIAVPENPLSQVLSMFYLHIGIAPLLYCLLKASH